MSASQTRSAPPPYGINLINEDDARSMPFPHFKEISYAARPHADKHLTKLRSTDTEEGDTGFPGDRPGQQSLPGPREAHK